MTQASIITIGDELLIGQTIDTNSAFIAQELNKLGIWVKRRIAIGDDKKEIADALSEQSKDCQIIIITGGLGPTADDITKPTLCDFFNGKLVVNDEALQNVKNIFNQLNKPLIERNLKQAEVPDTCMVLPNKRGTAPGMLFEKEGVIYISLPGVPHEMKGLLLDSVLPKLKEQFTLPAVQHRTIVTAGQGESSIAEILVDFEAQLPPHIKLAYLPAYGMVKLRLTGKSDATDVLQKEIDQQFEQLKALVKPWLVADKDITIQEVIGNILNERAKFMASAESCTGGYIAHLITSVAGASSCFKGSVVCYANDSKENILRVAHDTLVTHRAVSEETIIEMTKGIIKVMNVDYAVATSGIMGPDGGTPDKPVGTVWIAVGNGKKVVTKKHHFRYDRKRNIELTAHTALNMLRLLILEQECE
jgi:nicotinamide-nucleotide amidase